LRRGSPTPQPQKVRVVKGHENINAQWKGGKSERRPAPLGGGFKNSRGGGKGSRHTGVSPVDEYELVILKSGGKDRPIYWQEKLTEKKETWGFAWAVLAVSADNPPEGERGPRKSFPKSSYYARERGFRAHSGLSRHTKMVILKREISEGPEHSKVDGSE